MRDLESSIKILSRGIVAASLAFLTMLQGRATDRHRSDERLKLLASAGINVPVKTTGYQKQETRPLFDACISVIVVASQRVPALRDLGLNRLLSKYGWR